ncbi:MAG: hypothetical protein IT361_12775 [Gemmatimonadaceae bacterium]|nr:hypothetical protein [Gemmatimonadaceae bacterium]
MNGHWWLGLAGLALLATAGPISAQNSRMRIALPAFGAQIVMDTIGDVQRVQAPPHRVFVAASLVLNNLRIPIDVSDSVAGLVGAVKLMRNRNLAGTALSRYLECGQSMTGPRADSHRVHMPLLLMLAPAPDHTTDLRIALVASAQDNAGTSNTPVQCGSSGLLESQLRKAINEQLKVLP